ncbi:MAG: carbohydrate kinase family protein [Candidatus Bathyarchaeota archaeon]|nr:MAG: carbohydrate kinase family protein [Candidatus Bathyarchaeota archaeon]
MDKLFRVRKIARQGEESYIMGYSEAPGGSAANTIVGLARLGHQVGYVGKIGNDLEGINLLKSFTDEKVDVKGVIISKKGKSGIALVFVDERGERSIYVDPGVNDTLDLKEMDLAYANNTEILHLTSFIGEQSFKAQRDLVKTLSDVIISLDPGELYAQKGIGPLKPILKRCFIIFPNEREIKILTKKEYRSGAKTLIKEGVKNVAVKLGERGCYITNGKEAFLIDAFKARVIDTTGAGDAFCAGFLHGYLRGKDLYTCGKLANLIASRKIEKTGARNGLPRQIDLPSI